MADMLDQHDRDAAIGVRVAERQPGPRTGVILAAGRSERLASVTRGGSKATLRLGGLSLVERAVRTLLSAGIRDVIVVVGHEAGLVATVATSAAVGRVKCAFAEGWELGNGASLAAAERFLKTDELFVLVTADHVFGEGALESLLRAEGPAVLVDHAPQRQAWAEGTRVRLDGDRAVAFSKQLGDPSIDCGAFLLPASIFDAQRAAQVRGDATLAGAITELARRSGVTAVKLPEGCWWQDIDTPEDLRRARRLLRGSLTKRSDGPVSRLVNRPLSTRLSLALAPTRTNPDLVSFASFALALLSAWLLARRVSVGGAIAVQAASVLDGVDGELARLQLRSTAAGALLDGILDRLGDASIVAGMAIWALREAGDPAGVVALAVAATTGSMLSMASKDRIAALGMASPHERVLGWLLGGRDGRLLIAALAAVTGRPAIGLIAIVASSGLTLVLRMSSARKSGSTLA